MQTSISEKYRDRSFFREAEEVLRRCVHCGFCNATCPTFQLLGDELDGPRGRIYLVKQILEGASPTPSSRMHLDRCLTCLNCETTCPSGVHYSRLLEIGRELHHEALSRPLPEKLKRVLLRKVLLNAGLYKSVLVTGKLFSRLVPAALRRKIPPLGRHREPAAAIVNNSGQQQQTLIFLRGCVQQHSAPEINAAAARLFTALGYRIVESGFDRCCGALSHHNDATDEARRLARQNIDAWWPTVAGGAEAIVITASGCAAMIREYGHLLRDDNEYSSKAEKVASLIVDPAEILDRHKQRIRKRQELPVSIAYHAPCTQQHALGIKGVVENILQDAGFTLTRQSAGHLCCGSAGSYSILQPYIASRLQQNKLADLTHDQPGMIATANIGCMLHLQSGTTTPVTHWCQAIEITPPNEK